MRISATEEYGLRCLLVLARQGLDGQMSIADIATAEGISVPYASKLLAKMRQAGLVKAVRGRKGGFCISKQPGQVNLLEVITVLGGPLLDPDHCTKRTGQLEECVHTDQCSVHDILGSLAGQIAGFLAGKTLADLVHNERLITLSALTGDDKGRQAGDRP
ncbi:MAG: Rrf2 family transcriptional regulator [candidate division Zixibacteria bacterium]|nr:Rrf2 family transcriptional regulator [candidate division Zixibacteria bacterium]MDH3936899.1 Rrf2 family transcriptional regulator [candidate division Zixibacteria bacterium]MDH4034046.1 Rrf2 family transcriptional regulator [candidate division Zixibacteria bacterium]